MNMLGNIGSAFSAIIFPFFIKQHNNSCAVYLKPVSANSFFIFSAAVNLLAIAAWILIRPGKKLGSADPAKAKTRMIIFGFILAAVTIAVLLIKFLNS